MWTWEERSPPYLELWNVSAAFTGAEQQRTSHADDLKTFLEKRPCLFEKHWPTMFLRIPITESQGERCYTHCLFHWRWNKTMEKITQHTRNFSYRWVSFNRVIAWSILSWLCLIWTSQTWFGTQWFVLAMSSERVLVLGETEKPLGLPCINLEGRWRKGVHLPYVSSIVSRM